MDEERYTAIDRYLANEMNAAERQAFEEQLRQDKELAEKLNIYTEASRSLAGKQYSENSEKEFRKILATVIEDEKEGATQSSPTHWYIWAAAACITLALLAVAYSIIDKPEYTEYAHFQPLELTQRGDNSPLQKHAQDAFNAKDYNQAVVYINSLLQNDPENIDLLVHKGIALLELGRTEEAEAIFKQVSESPSVYQNQARWLLALSALKQKDYDRCETLLKTIPKDAGEYTDAQRLLDEL
jgi:predicted Zn-dependent protease